MVTPLSSYVVPGTRVPRDPAALAGPSAMLECWFRRSPVSAVSIVYLLTVLAILADSKRLAAVIRTAGQV
jgi:hypothetical protein